ncbi:hypothetical protein [Cyanobacterium aponinum]|uniref:hypothetical protein n=1 Tax=Cyanobacterium aponinum TaxID=379064 RepID=UPI000C12CDDE|nr:hypothetical protein [Cyanobacterium aponinum]PHV63196.1 hypothetical protein CSQ80_06585 [Cyanobacterium aponinum IPPAS B-1201]
MALSQHKIPIITGRNDVPTTSELEPNHPNGSFTTAKYNDLIDELNNLIPLAYNTIQAYPETIYVNAISGDDENGDGSQISPYATIQKAIDVICKDKIVYAEIDLTGIFTNPKLDFSNYYCLLSATYFDNWKPEEAWFNQAGLYITTTDRPNTKIVWDANLDNVNNEFTNIPYSLIYSPNNTIGFISLDFEITGNDNNVFIHSNLNFADCTFTLNPTDPNSWSDSVLHFFDCNVYLSYCSFTYTDANAYHTINSFNSNLYLSDSTVNYNDTTISLINAVNSVINLKNYPVGIILDNLKRCNIYIDFTGTDTSATLFLDENINNVKSYS